MSKDKKIIIEFDQDIIGDVTTVNPPKSYKTGTTNLALNKTITSNSSIPTNAIDGNENTYWYPSDWNSSGWIKIDLGSIKDINCIKYKSDSYRTKDYKVWISSDDSAYTLITTGTLLDIGILQTIIFTKSTGRYIKFEFLTSYYYYHYIYEMQIFEAIPMGNEGAFTVTGNEYDHINGTLVSTNYEIQSISRVETNKIALNINPYTRLRKPEGDITVQYAQSKGNLTGEGGAVVDFTKTFAPTDLVSIPNPLERERLSTSLSNLDIHTHVVSYKNGYETERLSTSLSNLSIVVTFVGTENP